MIRCAVTESIESHLREQEKQDMAFERFNTRVDENLKLISIQLEEIANIGEDFEGYDFTGSIMDMIKEL
jgi:hypothetical protein